MYKKPTAKQTAKLIERFNKKFPVGSTVFLRKCAVESSEYKPYTVTEPAYRDYSGEAVAFFDGISGCFSVSPDFIDYKRKTPSDAAKVAN